MTGGPASLAIGRVGYRGASRRPGGAVNAHSVRGELVMVPIQPGSWIYDVGTGGTAALSHLAFYQPGGPAVLSVAATYQATSTSGVRIFVPFYGTSFGLTLLRGQASAEDGGAFEMVIDGVAYPARRDPLWLSTIDTTGMGTLNHSQVGALAEDLSDGPHVAQLFFPGPRAAGTNSWFVGSWVMDRNCGYRDGVRSMQQITNSRQNMPTSQTAIYSMTSANSAQNIYEVWFHNDNVGAQTVTIQLSSGTVQIISIPASSSTRWTPPVPITVASSLTWAASSADVKFVLFGGC